MKIPSVRRSLALLVMGSVLPIVVMGAFVISTYYLREQTQVDADSIGRARAITSALDREFGATQAALIALASSPHLARSEFAEFHAQSTVALSKINAENLVLLDRTGQLLLSTARPFGTPLPKTANPVFLQRILNTGKPGVSDLFMGPFVGKLIYTVGVPVMHGESIIYSLNATLPPVHLLSVLTEQKLPPSWLAVITDGSGSIVARTHEMDKFFGKKVVPDLLKRMSVSNEDSFESKTLEGTPVLIAFSRSTITGWTVAIAPPLAELKAGIRQTLAQMLSVALIGLGIGLALAWFIGGRIATAFIDLIKPAKALGAGEAVTVQRLPIREANEVAEALIEAAKLLDQVSCAKADFLSSMSHELRTPLNAILGFAQLMESDSPPPTPAQKKSIDQIIKAGWDLLDLVNEVLNLALIESGKVMESAESVALTEIMFECRLMVDPHAEKSGVSVTYPQFAIPYYVHVDRSWVKQCLINLLTNAINYTKPGGTVVVDYALSTPGLIRISVRDTGGGLSTQQLAQIFQPFNWLGGEHGLEKSMGLSLVVTKRLVERMGGSIGVDSAVDVGSVFWIELNLTTAPQLPVQDAGNAAPMQA